MKKDWSNVGLIAFLPLLAVVMLYTTEIVWRNSFFFCTTGHCNESILDHIWNVLSVNPDSNPPSSTNLDERELTALRYGGRLTWYLLGEFYLFVCLAALVVAAMLIFQLSPHQPFVRMLGALLLSLLVGLFLFRNPKIHMAVFLIILEKTIKHDVPAIIPMTDFFNSLGNAAAFALLLASCATLFPSPETAYPQGMKLLSQKMKALRLVLYTGTILLVGTMLLKRAIFQWALAYTSQEEQAVEAARLFISNLLTMDGGFYTLILAAAYLPASLILQRRAQRLPDLPVEEPEKEKKLKEHGLVFSWAESFPRILAILGPFLVGPVGELLNVIVK